MTVHVLRDYPSATSGYVGNMLFTPYLYCLALFMHRVLGYSIVGQTGFNLDSDNSQPFSASASTNIDVASNGQILPQSTITVGSTSGFPASGLIYVTTSDGIQRVKYSGTTATTFTNCTGGTGTMTATVATTTTGVQALPTATINVTSTTGFPTNGTIYVVTSAGPQIVTYTGVTATSFTGCSGGTGSTSVGGAVTSAGGNVTCGQNKILAASGAPWTITTTFPHGMTTGEYASIGGAGSPISTIIPYNPYQVEVINSTQLKLVGSTGGGAYTTNAQTLFPGGMLIASGTNASINFGGAPSVYAVSVESTARTVVNGTAPFAGDTGRILVLKSNLYPTKNSGVFKITTTNTASNSYTINYRSTDTPPPESGMSWWLYEIETQASNYVLQTNEGQSSWGVTAATNTTPIQITYNVTTMGNFKTGQRVIVSGVNGNTNANGTWTITVNGYNTVLLNGSSGNGTYTSGGTITRTGYTAGPLSFNSKILLQSPHSTGWQVRLSIDPYNVPSVVPYTSISVGYGGISSGDFTAGGITTLTPQYLDGNIQIGSAYAYTVTGSANASNAPRITAVGDDTGRAVFCYARAQTGGSNGLITFGLPENEPSPLPVDSNRIFVYGSSTGATPDYGGIRMRGGNQVNVGFTYRDSAPEMCMIAGLTYADGSGSSPVFSANAGDNPFTSATELFPWEIWAGQLNNPGLSLPYGTDLPIYWSLNQRFMGTAPFLRQGRTNFGDFTLTTDSTATSTISGATNASPIQITTSSANALTTGQTVIIKDVTGNTAANGTWVITVIDNTHFTLTGSSGSGTYTGGGTVQGTSRWLHLQNGIYLQWNGAGGLT